jgi:hypothetical protein
MMSHPHHRTYLNASTIISCVLVLWCLAFIMTRLHMFQHQYAVKWQEYSNDNWLRQQCEESEFYHNMKHHSTICEDVSAKTHESIWLSAADHVARNSFLCGYSSCATLLEELVTWILGRGIIITSVLAGIVMVMPSILLPFFRRNYTPERFCHLEAPAAHRQLRNVQKSDFF